MCIYSIYYSGAPISLASVKKAEQRAACTVALGIHVTDINTRSLIVNLSFFDTKNAIVILKLSPANITIADLARNSGDIKLKSNAAPVVPKRTG